MTAYQVTVKQTIEGENKSFTQYVETLKKNQVSPANC